MRRMSPSDRYDRIIVGAAIAFFLAIAAMVALI